MVVAGLWACAHRTPSVVDHGAPRADPTNHQQNPGYTQGAIAGFRSLYVNPRAFPATLLPRTLTAGAASKATLPLHNPTMAWAEVAVNGAKVGVIGPLAHGAIHGVLPGTYEVSWTQPHGRTWIDEVVAAP